MVSGSVLELRSEHYKTFFFTSKFFLFTIDQRTIT